MNVHHGGFTVKFFDCCWDELPKSTKEGLNVEDAAALLVQWMLDARNDHVRIGEPDHVNLGACFVTIEETH